MSEERIDLNTLRRFKKAFNDIENSLGISDHALCPELLILKDLYEGLIEIKDHLNHNQTQKAVTLLENQVEHIESILNQWGNQ